MAKVPYTFLQKNDRIVEDYERGASESALATNYVNMKVAGTNGHEYLP